jgi:hypothetical protein
MFCDSFMNAPQAAVRPLLLAEERRDNLARRIVQRHDQVGIALVKPAVGARILMQHHPPHRLARALEPMLAPASARLHQPSPQQRQTHPDIAPL